MSVPARMTSPRRPIRPPPSTNSLPRAEEYDVLRHQAAGFLRKVDEDCAGFEYGAIVVAAIDDGGDAAIGIDLEIPLGLLFLCRKRQRVNGIGQPKLLQCDGDLPAIRCGGGVEVDHGASFGVRGEVHAPQTRESSDLNRACHCGGKLRSLSIFASGRVEHDAAASAA
jgi:hypothetical protein